MSFRSLIARPSTSADPFGFFSRDLDRFLTDALSGSLAAPVASFGAGVKMDVTENEKAVTVLAECPGVEEKDIDLSFNEGVLTIKGEKKTEHDEKTETLHLVERSYGSFSRSVAVPSEIDAAKIEASFAKGVLKVTLPKKEKATEQAHKIAIKSA